MKFLWHIDLFGTLCLRHGDTSIGRFRTRQTASLLAYLACFSDRAHPREVLVDMLWPDVDSKTGRARLSVALTALRTQLDTPSLGGGQVLQTDPFSVRLNPDTFITDIALFENSIATVPKADAPISERLAALNVALNRYNGPALLAGMYDPWIVPEQERLMDLYLRSVRELTILALNHRLLEAVLPQVRRAVQISPLHRQSHHDLILLLLASGEANEALEQWQEWKTRHQREFGTPLSAEDMRLEVRIQEQLRSGTPVSKESDIQGAAPSEPKATEPPVAPISPPVSAYTPALPRALTSFFGREKEVTALATLLREPTTRLVTVTGPGGMGKTRLTLEVSWHLAGTHFGGRVAAALLADLRSVSDLPTALRDAVKATPSPSQEPLEQVAAAVAGSPFLLVLDNLEHLVSDESAAMVQRLLTLAPQLTILVTSRHTLNLMVEQVFPLSTLPIPSARADLTRDAPEWQALLSNPCIALFTDRARSVRPDFRITTGNIPAIIQLCRILEGIPLALELAAVRASILTPTQMLEQVEKRYALLQSRKRDLPERHRSLRAVMDYSYALLSPRLRQLFGQLSVFRGGWTFDAAVAVCTADDEPIDSDDLAQLVECSLILADAGGEQDEDVDTLPQMRYRMLETLREYSAECFATETSSTEQIALCARHRAYFLSYAEMAAPNLQGAKQNAWLNQLAVEQENCIAALESAEDATEDSVAEEALRLATALHRFWLIRGPVALRRHWLEQSLRAVAPDAISPLRVSPRNMAAAFNAAGILASAAGDYSAANTHLRQCLALQENPENGLGATTDIARVLNNLGMVAIYQQDYATASHYLQDSLALYQKDGSSAQISTVASNLGVALGYLGDLEGARKTFEDCLPLLEAKGDDFSVASILHNLAYFVRQQEKYQESAQYLQRSLSVPAGVRAATITIPSLLLAASLLVSLNQPEMALRLFGAEEAAREQVGKAISPSDKSQYDKDMAVLQEVVSSHHRQILWQEGRSLSLEDAVTLALDVLQTVLAN